MLGVVLLRRVKRKINRDLRQIKRGINDENEVKSEGPNDVVRKEDLITL